MNQFMPQFDYNNRIFKSYLANGFFKTWSQSASDNINHDHIKWLSVYLQLEFYK
jgi:hypothetical protein